MLNAIHIVGQILFGGYFIHAGIKHFLNHRDYTAYAKMNKVPMAGTAVSITGPLLILGGLGMLFNTYTLIANILLIVFIIPVTFTMHAYWKSENPGERSAGKIQFMKNLALLGALLLLIQF